MRRDERREGRRGEEAKDIRYAADHDGVDEGSRTIARWVGHFLRHVEDHVKGDEGQGRLEEAEDPGYAVGPTRCVLEVGEDKVGVGLVRHGEEDDADDDDASDGPVD